MSTALNFRNDYKAENPIPVCCSGPGNECKLIRVSQILGRFYALILPSTACWNGQFGPLSGGSIDKRATSCCQCRASKAVRDFNLSLLHQPQANLEATSRDRGKTICQNLQNSEQSLERHHIAQVDMLLDGDNLPNDQKRIDIKSSSLYQDSTSQIDALMHLLNETREDLMIQISMNKDMEVKHAEKIKIKDDKIVELERRLWTWPPHVNLRRRLLANPTPEKSKSTTKAAQKLWGKRIQRHVILWVQFSLEAFKQSLSSSGFELWWSRWLVRTPCGKLHCARFREVVLQIYTISMLRN